MYSFVYDKISNYVLCCILIYTWLFVFISCRLFDMLVHYSVIYISAYVRNGWMAIQLILLKQNPNGVVRENGAIYMFIYYNIVDMFNYADTLCLVENHNVWPCFNDLKKYFKQGLTSVFIALQMLYFWK